MTNEDLQALRETWIQAAEEAEISSMLLAEPQTFAGINDLLESHGKKIMTAHLAYLAYSTAKEEAATE
jgi:hypothetical protein